MEPRTPSEDELLLELAGSVADRDPVEWKLALGRAPELAQTLSGLRLLETLAAVHESSRPSSPSLEPRAPTEISSTEAETFESWGPLRVLEVLGRGGFGSVYRAHDPRLDRDVALKVWHRSESDDAALLAEARALARLRHPNLPVVHGVDQHDGRLGMWTELVRGRTLEELLARHGPLGAREAALVAVEVCRALDAVHRAGLVHRDVKTSNVMREGDGRIVLLDFGLAIGQRSDSTGVHTAGTPTSMAPEVLRGRPASAASDLYAVGVLLYRLVTGAFPYTGRGVAQIVAEQDRGAAVPITSLRPDLPQAFARVVERAIAADPGARYPDAEAMERALLDFLGASTSEVVAVPRPAARESRLPRPLTHFVGRQAEVVATCEALGSHRLVTVTGPGGTGKTRLALRVAEALSESVPVAFADLSLVSEPATVATEVQRALGHAADAVAQDSLAGRIGSAPQLLVLDSCEHVLAQATSLVADLLGRCPSLSVLATSRSPLRIPGEKRLALPPLTVPPLGVPATAASISSYDAVRLFVDRARLVQPEFRLDDLNAAAVADVCRRSDGLPLAIELAAARSRALTPQEIQERLERELALLEGAEFSTAARHKSLDSAIRWTYDTLPESERSLVEDLAVFAGTWTLQAAARVCMDDADELTALDRVTGLIERSLVVTAPPCLGVSRYRFLDTLRRFALDRLRESGRLEALQLRHLQDSLAVAEEAEPRLWGADPAPTAARLDAEHPNLLAALGWSQHQPDCQREALRLAGSLARFWTERGHLSLGREALERALERAHPDMDPTAYARALLGAGTLAVYQSDHEQARSSCERALEMYRRLEDPRGIARTLVALGVLGHDIADYGAAQDRYRESLEIFRSLEDTRGVAHVLNNMGAIAWRQGEWEEARRLLEEALAQTAKLQDPGLRALSLTNLGLVALHQGRSRDVIGLIDEALRLVQAHGLKRHGPSSLEVAAAVLAKARESARAARLYAAAAAQRRPLGSSPEETWRLAHEPTRQAIARDLGGDTLQRESETGAALDPEHAIEEARQGLELLLATKS